jgi:hypothetical protein
MRHHFLRLVACCLLAALHPAMAYESRGARSCMGWQEFRQAERDGYLLNAEVYQTWMVGYLSGIVAGSGIDFLAGTDNETIFLMVDAYCSRNREMNLSAAGTHVARELLQQKGIVNTGTLP